MTSNWNEDFDSDGLTPGPEVRLEREIARSKNLKVERLQLKDRVSTLENQIEELKEENAALRKRLVESGGPFPPVQADNGPATVASEGCGVWVNGWVAVGLITCGVLGWLFWR